MDQPGDKTIGPGIRASGLSGQHPMRRTGQWRCLGRCDQFPGLQGPLNAHESPQHQAGAKRRRLIGQRCKIELPLRADPHTRNRPTFGEPLLPLIGNRAVRLRPSRAVMQ